MGYILDETRACIFDLDGTLVDSMWIWTQIDREYLAKYSLEVPTDLEKSLEGMSFTQTAKYFKDRFKIDKTVEEIKADWEQMSLDKYKNEVSLKSGVEAFLKFIKSNNIKTGIATSNGRKIAEAVLDSLKIRQYFDVLVTSCEVKSGKPAPDVYLKVAEMLNEAPKDCLVFEDIIAGIKAGKNAGMRVIAIEDIYSLDYAGKKKELADFYIKDFTEVFKIKI